MVERANLQSGSSVTDVTDYLRRASLWLMKLKWAGSQTKPAERHASTQDWPSCDTSSLRELRGGQTGGAETLDDQPRAVEFGRGTKRGPVVLVPPAEPGLEKLAGTKRGSMVQKSCGCKMWRLVHYCSGNRTVEEKVLKQKSPFKWLIWFPKDVLIPPGGMTPVYNSDLKGSFNPR